MVPITSLVIVIKQYKDNQVELAGRIITSSIRQLVRDAPKDPLVDTFLKKLIKSDDTLPKDAIKVLNDYEESKRSNIAYL
jgi:hypothetical protein